MVRQHQWVFRQRSFWSVMSSSTDKFRNPFDGGSVAGSAVGAELGTPRAQSQGQGVLQRGDGGTGSSWEIPKRQPMSKLLTRDLTWSKSGWLSLCQQIKHVPRPYRALAQMDWPCAIPQNVQSGPFFSLRGLTRGKTFTNKKGNLPSNYTAPRAKWRPVGNNMYRHVHINMLLQVTSLQNVHIIYTILMCLYIYRYDK